MESERTPWIDFESGLTRLPNTIGLMKEQVGKEAISHSDEGLQPGARCCC